MNVLFEKFCCLFGGVFEFVWEDVEVCMYYLELGFYVYMGVYGVVYLDDDLEDLYCGCCWLKESYISYWDLDYMFCEEMEKFVEVSCQVRDKEYWD